MPFAKNIGKNLSNKHGQKLLDSAKKSTTDAIKTTLKRAIQKAVEATDDLIGNKIADKITSVSKKSSTEHSKNYDANTEIEVPRKRYISPEEKRQIIDELRLLQQYNNRISKDLLDSKSNQSSEFRTKNWVEINDESRGTYSVNSQINFKTSMLSSSLCDYSGA